MYHEFLNYVGGPNLIGHLDLFQIIGRNVYTSLGEEENRTQYFGCMSNSLTTKSLECN